MDFASCLHSATLAARRLARRAVSHLRRAEGWRLAAYVAVGLFLLAVALPLALAFALAALVVAAVLAWVHEFVWLMRLDDSAFPGRHDKLVWSLLMIALPPIGLLAFWAFRRAHWIEVKDAYAADDLG